MRIKLLKIDRYILEETAGTFFGTCIFTLFILIMFQILRLAEFFIVHGASGFLLGKMTFFLALTLLPIAFPLSFLLAVLVAFGRLSADSEIIAMKANGLSIYRLSAPIFGFALLISAVSIGLNIKWVPWSQTGFKTTERKVGNTRAVMAIKEGTFTSGFFDLLLFADKVDSQNNRLYRVFIFDEREAQNPLTYVAREADILPVKASTEMGSAILLRLKNGTMHHDNLETHTYEKMDFEIYNLYLKIDGNNDSAATKPYMMTQEQLQKEIDKNPVNSYEWREFQGEYWRRYATAISPMFFVLIGIGFGIYRNRSAKSGSILTGIIILLLYWTTQTVCMAAMQRGLIPPILAVQLPNIAILLAGFLGFRKAAW